MDWAGSVDDHKKFKQIKQKWELIFSTEEAHKVRHMLLSIDHKGLKIYNTATFDNPKDRPCLWKAGDILQTPK